MVLSPPPEFSTAIQADKAWSGGLRFWGEMELFNFAEDCFFRCWLERVGALVAGIAGGAMGICRDEALCWRSPSCKPFGIKRVWPT